MFAFFDSHSAHTQKPHQFIRKTVLLFLVAFLFLSQGQDIFAQVAPQTIELSPAFYEVSLLPEQAQTSIAITIKNQSNNDQEFEVSMVEIQQFDAEGRVVLADKPIFDKNTPPLDFVTTPKNRILIPARQSLSVPFDIKNLQALAPGGHYVSIVFRATNTRANQQQILPAVSSFILIRKKGGEQFHLSLQDVSAFDRFFLWSLPQSVDLLFSNQGNTHVIPRGTISVEDLSGRLIAKSIINENSLYVFPGTERKLPQQLKNIAQPFPISLLKYTISGTSQPGDVKFTQAGWIMYLNPVVLFLSVVVLGVMSGFAWLWVKRKKLQSYDSP